MASFQTEALGVGGGHVCVGGRALYLQDYKQNVVGKRLLMHTSIKNWGYGWTFCWYEGWYFLLLKSACLLPVARNALMGGDGMKMVFIIYKAGETVILTGTVW